MGADDTAQRDCRRRTYRENRTGWETAVQTGRHDRPGSLGHHVPLTDRTRFPEVFHHFPAQCLVRERSSRRTRRSSAHPSPVVECALSSTVRPRDPVRTTAGHDNSCGSFRSMQLSAHRQKSLLVFQHPVHPRTDLFSAAALLCAR